MRRSLPLFLAILFLFTSPAHAAPYPKHLSTGLGYTALGEDELPLWRRAKNAVERWRGDRTRGREIPMNETALAAVVIWAIKHHSLGLNPQEFLGRFGTPSACGKFLKRSLIEFLDPHQIYFLDRDVDAFMADGDPAEVFRRFKAGDWSPLYNLEEIYGPAVERYNQYAFDPNRSEDVEAASGLITRYALQLTNSILPLRRAQQINGLRARVLMDVSRRMGRPPKDPGDLHEKVHAALLEHRAYVREGRLVFSGDSLQMRTVFAALIRGLDPESSYVYGKSFRPAGFSSAAPEHSVEEVDGRRLAYLRVHSLDVKAFRQSIAAIQAEEAAGLVLDLRGTEGGTTYDAMQIGGVLTGGHIAFTFQQLQPQLWNRQPEPALTLHKEPAWYGMRYARPLVVLIDSATRGPAELLVSALEDYNRAVVLGSDRTYGSGAAQTAVDLRSLRFIGPQGGEYQLPLYEMSQLVLSVSYALNASGVHLHGAGVRPDHVILTGSSRQPYQTINVSPTGAMVRPAHSDLYLSGEQLAQVVASVKEIPGLKQKFAPDNESAIRAVAFEALDDVITQLGPDFSPQWEEPKASWREKCEELFSLRIHI